MLVELTEDEFKEVQKYRETQAFYKARADKRAACSHTWKVGGYAYGETLYECGLCGESKWQ